MEELYAELLLWYAGFHSSERYDALLDEKFLNNPENKLYLELEECSSNLLDSIGRFSRYWDDAHSEFDKDTFGKRLFSGLKATYNANNFEILKFGNRCYKLWQMLPDNFYQTEPFHTLSYADDPLLSWGDEAQTRELYERAFSYYC